MTTLRNHSDLPAADLRPAAADAIAADALASARVLVVDDDPANVRLLERVLQMAGTGQVHGTTDPREAVRLAIDLDVDLVLLDLNMPFVDGFEVMAGLRAVVPEGEFLPVLVLTADATRETRDRALRAGAKDLLHKPFDVREVTLRARNLLETRALYGTVQRHNAELQATLDRRSAADREAAADLEQRRERVHSVLSGAAFSTVFQPIADLRTGEIIGAEALARFPREPHRPPNEWFDEAASVGLGTELEIAAVAAALEQVDRLPPGTFLSVNTSPDTAAAPALGQLLAEHDTSRIVLELTEHSPVVDYRPLLVALDGLRQLGVRIAVDDTGAGYAGLRHLLHLRPDIIKLDIGLTSGIDVDPAKHALSAALVTFAADVGACIVAEGIETHGELEALRRLGITWGQGYLLARPAPLPLRPDASAP